MTTQTPGELAYIEDCRRLPFYHDGTPRGPWATLGKVSQWSWERDPVAREWPADVIKAYSARAKVAS